MTEQTVPSHNHSWGEGGGGGGTIRCKICQALDHSKGLFEVFRSNRICLRNVFGHFFSVVQGPKSGLVCPIFEVSVHKHSQ